MSSPSCTHTLLATTGTHQITRCCCGHVHITIGPVTLRVDEEVLRDLAGLFAKASAASERLGAVTGHTGVSRH